MPCKTNYFTLLLIVTYATALAQPITFQHLSSDDGLTSNRIYSIAQDSAGYLWIATDNGLCKYDGTQFQQWYHDENDSFSLSSNVVYDLQPSKKGGLWIGTQQGLNYYHPQTGRFTHWLEGIDPHTKSTYHILSITTDAQNRIWCTTYHGIYILHQLTTNNWQIDSILHQNDNDNSPSTHIIWELLPKSPNSMWAATNNGLDLITQEANGQWQITHHRPDPNNPHSISHAKVWELGRDKNGMVWVGTMNGLDRFDPSANKPHFQHYLTNDGRENFGEIYALHLDNRNHLWVGMHRYGLFEAPLQNNAPLSFTQHTMEDDQPGHLSSNIVKEIYCDRSGIVWVGTVNGINKYDPYANRFIHHQKAAAGEPGLSSDLVQAILTDHQGYTWIAMNGGGLDRLQLDPYGQITGEVSNYTNANSDLSSTGVFSLLEDSKGNLWIGTYKGLNRIHLNTFHQTGHWDTWLPDDAHQALVSGFIFDLYEDSHGFVWAATYGGLSRISPSPSDQSQLSFTNFTSEPGKLNQLINSTSYCLAEDQWQRLWIGTFGGLSLATFNPQDSSHSFRSFLKEVGNPNSLSDNKVNVLYRDAKNRMWLGNSAGLSRIVFANNHPDSISFQKIDLADAPNNLMVHSIEEDSSGLLWLGTNEGIYRYDPDCQNASPNTNSCLFIFDEDDGLQSNMFNKRCSFKDRKGWLYFGGVNGFNIIDPSKDYTDHYQPDVALTEFRLFNQQVLPHTTTEDGRTLLNGPLSNTEQLTLNYRDKVFSFGFTALGFSQPHKQQFAYRMDPFNQDWINAGTQRQATYTNLDPGTYTFRVKARNHDGIWSKKEARLIIEIIPPLWATWWAYCIYVLAGLSLIYALFKFRERQQRQKLEAKARVERARLEERETIRKKNAADFHDELGHQLTRINLFADLAKRESSENAAMQEYLQKIALNTKSLSEGVRDLLWVMNPENDTLDQTLVRLKTFGDQLFEYTDINFELTGLDDQMQHIHLEADTRKHLLLLFKEAMNNSLKYAACLHSMLQVHLEDDQVSITFQDDGKGFDPMNGHKGYGLQNMADRAKAIGGTLALHSQPNQGTRITLLFKITQMGYPATSNNP